MIDSHKHVFDTAASVYLDSSNGIRLGCNRPGCPVSSGGPGSTITVTHLVDEESGRLYLEIDYRYYATVFLNGHKVYAPREVLA